MTTRESEQVEGFEQVEGVEPAEPIRPLGERLTFAIRQSLIMAVVLLVLARLTDSSRPAEGGGRDLVSSPFLWAIVIWVVLLVVHAVAFERSQMPLLESVPLLISIGLAAVAFLVGVSTYDAGSTGDRLLYLALDSVGVGLFWWAIIGTTTLLWTLTGARK